MVATRIADGVTRTTERNILVTMNSRPRSHYNNKGSSSLERKSQHGGIQIHKPVLLREALEGLNIKSDGIYVDATFGRGGHSLGILEKLGPKGRVYALDKDSEAAESAIRDI